MPPLDALQAQLLELKRSYARQLPEKIARIDNAFQSFFAAAWEEQTCATTYRLIHSLAGSSGTYGYAEICQVARLAEAILKTSQESRTLPGSTAQQEALRLTARLKDMAEEASRKLPS